MKKIFWLFLPCTLFLVVLSLPKNSFSQYIGIGTTTPAFKLDVRNGNINTDGDYFIDSNRVLSVRLLNTFVGIGTGGFLPGNNNTAIGHNALQSNSQGFNNTANGIKTLRFNTDGNNNTATGAFALFTNGTGSNNTANGSDALAFNITGNNNTAIGYGALNAITTGHSNTAIGTLSGATISSFVNTTAIGSLASVTTSNKVRIGDISVTVIEGQVGFSHPSDGRFKSNVQEDVPGLSFINRLRPVSYHFETRKFAHFLSASDSVINANKSEYENAEKVKHTGLIAQELEAVCKEIGYEFSGLHKPQNSRDNYSIAYDNLIPVLIKAIQEQQQMIEQLKKQNEELLKRIDKIEMLLNTKTTMR